MFYSESMPRFFRQQKGFTLLELLVVISIIGLLIAMIAVSFGTAQKKGRDAKRRADVKSLQNAFEQYYAANNSVYDSVANCSTMKSTTYLPGGQPVDPQTGSAYTCRSSSTAYCVCALLEDEDRGNATGDAGSTTCSYGTGDYYCLSQLQ
jgi:prepilin-type N-terminal cleavage/methylation domain-containing protein